jgi:hypothetical protein
MVIETSKKLGVNSLRGYQNDSLQVVRTLAVCSIWAPIPMYISGERDLIKRPVHTQFTTEILELERKGQRQDMAALEVVSILKVERTTVGP